MLIQNDPFRDFDALFGRLGRSSNGTVAMPMDAFRRGSDVWVQIDLPGVAADSLVSHSGGITQPRTLRRKRRS